MNYELSPIPRPSRLPRSCGPHPGCQLLTRYCSVKTPHPSCGRIFHGPSLGTLRGAPCFEQPSGADCEPGMLAAITRASQVPLKSRTGFPPRVNTKSSGCFPFRSSVSNCLHSSVRLPVVRPSPFFVSPEFQARLGGETCACFDSGTEGNG
jgi:hypothetical protein